MGFNLMNILDPGGIGKTVLNWNPMTKALAPYLGEVGGLAGGIIGGIYGGPGGAALGSGVGEMGGTQLSSYLMGQDPFSGTTLKRGATKGAIAAGTSYLAGTAAGAARGGAATSGGFGEGLGEYGEVLGGGYEGGFGGGLGEYGEVVGDTSTGYQSPVWYSYTPAGEPVQHSILFGSQSTPGGGGWGAGGSVSGAGQGATPGDFSLMGSSAPPSSLTGTTTPSSSVLPQGGTLDTLAGYYRKAMPYLAGAGLVSNVAGNYLQSKQGQQNLEDYINATTWTPERSAAYLAGTGQNVAGTLAGSAATGRGTLAEQMASRGRGGGVYGNRALGIEASRLNALANARNAALATVSTPPNLNAGAFMTQTNPWAASLQGFSGAAGQGLTAGMNAMLLAELLRRRNAAAY